MQLRHFNRCAIFIRLRVVVFFIAIFADVAVAANPKFDAIPGDESEFLTVDQAFKLTAVVNDHRVHLHWLIAQGYYLYQQRVSLELMSGLPKEYLTDISFLQQPSAQLDPNYGRVNVYRKHLDLVALLKHWKGAQVEPLHLLVKYQGCVSAGLCYPLQLYEIQILADGIHIININRSLATVKGSIYINRVSL